MRTLPTLFEDDHLWVIDKPAGLLTLPDRFDTSSLNLINWLRDRYGEAYIVHRLDRDTSGVIVVAKTEAAHRELNQQFEARTVEKIYHALLDGQPPTPTGSIEQAIAPDKQRPGRMQISSRGKAALTEYRVLENLGPFTWVEVVLHTGRTHQIRVHFQAIGLPLLVDPLYGRREAFLLSEIKGRSYNRGKEYEERPLLARTALHASRLAFDHPVSGVRLSFEAPLPKDLRAVLNQLRKRS